MPRRKFRRMLRENNNTFSGRITAAASATARQTTELPMLNINAIQAALVEFNVEAWFLYDFRSSNILAKRVLGLDNVTSTRRWAYVIPARGEPKKLVHRIEPAVLSNLPGDSITYLSWQSFEAGVRALVGEYRTVAMEFSPKNGNPALARVDAGTVDLVRSFGANVVSSGNLIQKFEAVWDAEQWQLHLEADQVTTSAFDMAFAFIERKFRTTGFTTETEVQQAILEHFASNNVVTYSPPIVALNNHSGDPHYETPAAANVIIAPNDFVLIDLWGKMNKPRAVYSDLTRVAFAGTEAPRKHREVFQIVAAARDAAIELVKTRFLSNTLLYGWEVDQAARDVIEAAGFGEYFVHRTGHSIGQETHGNGANMDNLETRETREILKGTCFSIEPGIYLPEFGIRSEVNVFVDWEGHVHVTGGPLQQEIQLLH